VPDMPWCCTIPLMAVLWVWGAVLHLIYRRPKKG
jgi:hypothetical protein